MLTVLAKVASRRNPTIDLGPVDLSSSFVVSDALKFDYPIVYVSTNFETLTGYQGHEIMGKNCRFLQAPGGVVERGRRRLFVDDSVVYMMKKNIEEFKECQYVNVNYKKNGEVHISI